MKKFLFATLAVVVLLLSSCGHKSVDMNVINSMENVDPTSPEFKDHVDDYIEQFRIIADGVKAEGADKYWENFEKDHSKEDVQKAQTFCIAMSIIGSVASNPGFEENPEITAKDSPVTVDQLIEISSIVKELDEAK